MRGKPYGLICPITHACEILEPRWTIPILTELWNGSTRFNDIRRGVGNISTALLAKRLKDLEANGLIERVEDRATGQVDYVRTQRAIDLEPALNALGAWAQCNIEARQALSETDVSTLMWNMRRYIKSAELPQRQVVIQFHFTDPGLSYHVYWALSRPGVPLEICTSIPDFDIDLYIETSAVSLSSIMLSRSTIRCETDAGRLFMTGDASLIKTMERWLYHRKTDDPSQVRTLEEEAVKGAGGTRPIAARNYAEI